MLIRGGTVWDVRAQIDPAVWARGRAPLMGALVAAMLVVGGIFGFVWWLHRYAVKRQLRPHRDDIAAIVRQLDANGTGEEA
jgi:hypothetical protein